MSSTNNTLWSGRFSKKSAKSLSEFNDSFSFDQRLYKEDIEGSIAYAKALRNAKLLTTKEANKIISTFKKFKAHKMDKNEDIHSAIENKLVSLIGDTGKKLHTGRSRNDQIVTDIRLWLKKEVFEIISRLKTLRKTFIKLAKKYYKTILPGYTHLQQAQVITLGHYLLAYEQKLQRDQERFTECLKRIDVLPLGSGALAGSGFNINRKFLAKNLHFQKVSENSLDAVSDRDFICEALFNISLLNIHLSQLAEEMILWSTKEFCFITISDAYATGSSMMPHKKNPDIPELIRGKTGRLIGNLMGMLTVLKGLPLAYNKDLQEDKEYIFDSTDQIKIILKITNEFLQNISFNKDKMYTTAKNSFINATEVADYLVKKGIPFRKAHEITGKIVLYCIKKGKLLSDLSINEWTSFNKAFNHDIIKVIQIESCINLKKIHGATSPNEVLRAIKRIRIK